MVLEMSDKTYLLENSTNPMVYQVRLKGQLGKQWEDWFDGLAISNEANGETILTGPITDQAALHGLFKKIRDLGLPLLELVRVEPKDAHL